MSRYSGPQGSGAAAKLHNQRRVEAEARQREERERDAKRRAKDAAAPPVKPLTSAERAELLVAAAIVAPDELLDVLRRRASAPAETKTEN